MSFQVSALPSELFAHLFAMDDGTLALQRAKRILVEVKPGVPCRVSLADAEPGEHAILVPYRHQPAESPYRASGPIFVREGVTTAVVPRGDVPDLLRSRLLSVRAYDNGHLMVDAEVVDGRELESVVARMFDDVGVEYLHVHYARPGCYACRIDRRT